jgi:hypothetical protein
MPWVLPDYPDITRNLPQRSSPDRSPLHANDAALWSQQSVPQPKKCCFSGAICAQ